MALQVIRVTGLNKNQLILFMPLSDPFTHFSYTLDEFHIINPREKT